ncbi:MAG: type II toxin-antitoxin system RelE/ParE family toxin [Nitrospinae bacterium]|nr:type II toxin-antitoxin system RelE/ParE family toxin [Nitrospinota bacterium]
MAVFYKSAFRKFVKKQTRPFQLAIEDEIDRIKNNPSVGEDKKGDLAAFKVSKFKFHHQQYLIAYEINGNDITIYMMGTHENFYRDLKRYTE